VSPTPRPASHAENFSLQDFLPDAGRGVLGQIDAFAAGWATEVEAGTLYMRELASPADAVVTLADGRELVMLGSNNYLGLANHTAVKEAVKAAIDAFGVGCGGPPLLNGTTRLHRQLEARLAALKGAEDALLFSSGFLANVGWVCALMRSQDVLIYDELSHASLHDALRLARCRSRFFAHNDVAELEALLAAERRRSPDGLVVVAVEGVYSMDGDLAPLPALREACDRYGAWLAVDDAHGTGVLGLEGAGTAAHLGLPHGAVEVAMGTFSKAFGTVGGFVAGPKRLIDYMRFFARAHMFSAALPHPVVATVLAGLDVMRDEPWRQARLHENAAYLVAGLRAMGLETSSASGIVPVFVPAGVDMRALTRGLHQAGIFVNAIEAPAVPADSQRLRFSVMATHTQSHLDAALGAIREVGQAVGLVR
jgi:8-amino-7-oxononanoate synthase